MDYKKYYINEILPLTPQLNLIDSIKADLKLQRKVRVYAKAYKRTFPKMKIRECIDRAIQLAYSELVIIEGTPIILNALTKDQ